jgi:3-oxoacyl-[acyl-carrier protein] reductase
VNFNDTTVLITGASRGIGAATARHFAELGAAVVLTARDAPRLEALAAGINNAGGRALATALDVMSYDAVAAAVARAVEHFGGLDVLVNNAGLIEPIGRLGDCDPAAWDRVIDVNVKGVFHGLHASIPAMLARGGGTVINISSGAATRVLEGWSHYCASKAAVLSLTRSVDMEYRDAGIRVIGLSPGTVATDMQVAIRESGMNPVSQLDPAVHISPDWVARAIAYLCGPGGDEFLGTDFSLKSDESRARVGLPGVGN